MKQSDLIVLGLAGLAVYMIVRSRGTTQAAGTTTTQRPRDWVTEIANTVLPGQTGYGWRSVDNGTAISPTGDYYFHGEKIWTPESTTRGYG